MKAAAVGLAIALAVAVQTTLARFVVPGLAAVDLVLVVVVYVALRSGPVSGLLAGTLGGLVQDVLSSGIVGIGGLAKTVVGFVTGVIAAQFIVAHVFSRILMFVGATLLHATVFFGLYALVEAPRFGVPYAAILGEAVGNAAVGVVAFHLVELLPGMVERRRAGRSRVRLTRRME